MILLTSACLMGIDCRYNGERTELPALSELLQRHTLIPVCPETLGGMPTPREPAERCGSRVVTRSGADVTEFYERGAKEALRIARLCGCTCALLKERSPSCGCGIIHDGSFSGALAPGSGVCAEALQAAGIPVLGESEIAALLQPQPEK